MSYAASIGNTDDNQTLWDLKEMKAEFLVLSLIE
jgi:hypothetical protein